MRSSRRALTAGVRRSRLKSIRELWTAPRLLRRISNIMVKRCSGRRACWRLILCAQIRKKRICLYWFISTAAITRPATAIWWRATSWRRKATWFMFPYSIAWDFLALIICLLWQMATRRNRAVTSASLTRLQPWTGCAKISRSSVVTPRILLFPVFPPVDVMLWRCWFRLFSKINLIRLFPSAAVWLLPMLPRARKLSHRN